MRVTCESCGAQYNLPDTKVRGRKAKVRCKKCSASIVVDGTSLPPGSPDASDGDYRGFEEEDEATAVMQSPLLALGGSAGADVWTVNVSDEDQRELTTEQVAEGWLDGTITADSFVWRDGMPDWLGVMDVPELADAVRARQIAPEPKLASAPRAPTPTPNPVAVAPQPEPKPASQPKPAPLPFASPGVATRQARPAAFDLFGPPRSLERTSEPLIHTGPKPSEVASSENSVMFSLDALKAAAGTRDSVKPADSRASEDLLTMGGAGLAGASMGAPFIEIIPTHAPPPTAIANPVAPLMVPQAPPKKSPVWLWGLGGAAVLLVGFFGGRMLMPAAPETSTPGEEQVAEQDPEKKAEEEKAAAEKKAEEEKAAAEKKAEEEKAEEEKKAEAEKPEAQRKPAAPSAPREPSGPSTPAEKPAPATGASPSKPKETTPSTGGGKAFDVGAAKTALNAAAARAASCKVSGGPTGAGKVQVTFATSGRVTSARVVSGPFGGTAVGGCVAREFRGATVPAFDGAPTTVSKNFTIN